VLVRAVYLGKSGEQTGPATARSDQFGTQKVSKHTDTPAHYGKTDIRYWQRVVFQPKYIRKGVAHRLSEWVVKIQHLGRRETLPLGTPNRAAAAAKARQIYITLKSNGWESTLRRFKAKPEISHETATTVGEFLEQVISTAGGRPKTVQGYCRAFRTIIADIFKADGGLSKFDYRAGGREKWIARIHAIKLKDVTPDKIQKWKVAFLTRAGIDPVRRRAARSSVNSFMRQAKGLFAPKVLKFIGLNISGTPFDGVQFEPRQSMRYRSSLGVKQLIHSAQDELPQEQLKVFLLALMAGLRRNEIDKLEWPSFRWTQNAIRIEATRFLQPKTEESIGDVEVDPELMEFFRGFKAGAKSNFVIESDVGPRMHATYSHYRCQRDFTALTEWLRTHGVESSRPLHALRKEYGSQVCAKHGIYAASLALRHADIAITSAHYLDQRKRSTVGLGNLLKASADVVPINGEAGPDGQPASATSKGRRAK
jgi:hypothetical protein